MNIIKVNFDEIEGKTIIDPKFIYISPGARTQTLTNLEIGKHYLVNPTTVHGKDYWTQAGTHISAYTGCECTFLANWYNTADNYNEYVVLSHYYIVPTESTVTLTFQSESCFLEIIQLD